MPRSLEKFSENGEGLTSLIQERLALEALLPKEVFSDHEQVRAAFKHFRATGFPYPKLPVHTCMAQINELALTPQTRLLHTVTAMDVANSYHPHRYHGEADRMKSPFTTFSDDRLFRGALYKSLELDRKIGKDFVGALRYYNGTHALSNFRPGFALSIYQRYAPKGGTILDSSTGFGGRLTGFIASQLGRYIGVDPSTPTDAGNRKLTADLGQGERVELHKLPAEDVPHEIVRGRADLCFTSPPYFAKERYADEPTQSFKRYRTFGGWVEGFLVPMLRLQWAALKPGGYNVVNIADVRIEGKERLPLVAETMRAALALGFQHVRDEGYPCHYRLGAGREEAVSVEPVLVFRKPDN